MILLSKGFALLLLSMLSAGCGMAIQKKLDIHKDYPISDERTLFVLITITIILVGLFI